jgi:hypothetical protein
MRKLRPPKVVGVNNSKNKTIEPYKTWFSNTQKFLVYHSIVIKVEIWLVKLKVAFLQHFKIFKMNKKWESYELWK